MARRKRVEQIPKERAKFGRGWEIAKVLGLKVKNIEKIDNSRFRRYTVVHTNKPSQTYKSQQIARYDLVYDRAGKKRVAKDVEGFGRNRVHDSVDDYQRSYNESERYAKSQVLSHHPDVGSRNIRVRSVKRSYQHIIPNSYLFVRKRVR